MGGFISEGQSPIENVGICQIQKERMLGTDLGWVFVTMSHCESKVDSTS